MKSLGMIAVMATLALGAGAVYSQAENASTAKQPATTAKSAWKAHKGNKADRAKKREKRHEFGRELHQRTLTQLGVTEQQMFAARKAALASMAKDGLVPQDRADKMLKHMQAMEDCRTAGTDPRECRGKLRDERRGAHKGGKRGDRGDRGDATAPGGPGGPGAPSAPGDQSP